MSKNKNLDFTNNITSDALIAFTNFKTAIINKTKTDKEHSKVIKELNKELNTINDKRTKAISEGMTINEATSTFSTADVVTKITAVKRKHTYDIKPFVDDMKKAYTYLPDALYNGYVKKVTTFKAGMFKTAINEFLINIGFDSVNQSQINHFSDNISMLIGAKVTSSKKKIINDEKLTSEISKTAFNKLFVSAFCDIIL